MKIIKRNFEHRNVIIFLIFSVAYLQAVFSLSKGISFYGLHSLSALISEHLLILILVGMALYSIIKVKKHSDKILLLVLCVITAKNFILLSSSFNKLVLALNFMYLIFAFYFFVIWEMEIGKASYNPAFSRYDLEKLPRFFIKGTMASDGQQEVEIYITNIDEYSAFVYLPQVLQPKLSASRPYVLKVTFEGVDFEHSAQIVSSYDQGYGLVLLKKEGAGPDWSDLHKVCLERGLFA